MRSLTKKTIRIFITLGEGTFTGGGNTKIIEGLACTVGIQKSAPPDKNKASVQIWGLGLEDMAQMTLLAFKPLKSLKNLIAVQAGELAAAELPVIFKGEFTSAFADFTSGPDIAFRIEAETGAYPALIPSKQQSVHGTAAAADLMAQYAKEAGYSFRNDGITSSVRNAVFNGSPLDKIRAVADQVGCELLIDDGMVIAMPAGGTRRGNAVLLNRDTGLVGYPTFTNDGIVCNTIFNHDFKVGGVVRVESTVPRSTGNWKITRLTHSISAYSAKDSSWASSIDAAYLGE